MKASGGTGAGPPLMLAEYLLHWLLRPPAGMLLSLACSALDAHMKLQVSRVEML